MNILLISYYFAPKNAIGAIRATKIAKYLKSNNCNVDVITLACNDEIKDSMLNEDAKELDISYVNHSKIYNMIQDKIMNKYLHKKDLQANTGNVSGNKTRRKKVLNKLKMFINFIFVIIQSVDFKNKSKKDVMKIIKENNIEVVFASYGPLPTLFLTKWIMKKKPNLKFVVDFRDPININGSYESVIQKYFNRLAKYFVKKSNRVTCVTNGIKTYLSKFADSEEKDKIVTIYNGFDEEDLKYIVEGEKKDSIYRFCYTGSLYRGRRDITPLFECLSKLINENIIEKDKIEFHYAGYEEQEIRLQADKYNLMDIIVLHGFLERKESLRLQYDCDINVISTWNTKKEIGVIPGKFYESMLLHKDVLAIIDGDVENSEIKQLIERYNLGFAYESVRNGNKDLLFQFIMKLYLTKIEKQNIEDKNSNKKYDKFSYNNIALKIKEIMEK